MLRRKSLIAAMLLITMSLEGPSPYTVYAGQKPFLNLIKHFH